MDVKVVSKTIQRGKQRWQHNADGSWSVLMFGSFGPDQVGLCYRWVSVDGDKVPREVKDLA